MNFMKLSAAASAILAAVTFTACDDSSSADDKSYDCTVKGGVKVLYPEGGESFKLGETITVIFGSDVEDSGYRFLLKTSEKDLGLDLLDSSVTVPNPDGKKCFEQKVVLSEDALPDDVELPLKGAIIRVSPYIKTSEAANSGAFKLTE